MSDPREELEGDLFAHLRQIDDRLREFCDAGFVRDPDELEDELRLEASYLRYSVEELAESLDESRERSCNLNDIVDLASRQLLDKVGFPIVVRFSKSLEIPSVGCSREVLHPVVMRGLQLCVEHAGPGCHIEISTTSRDSHAVLEVRTSSLPADQKQPLPIQLRCISLADFLRSQGGDVVIERSAESLTLSLLFGISAPIS